MIPLFMNILVKMASNLLLVILRAEKGDAHPQDGRASVPRREVVMRQRRVY